MFPLISHELLDALRLISGRVLYGEKMKERKFIKLPPEKAPQMFDLVLERMKWMDEKGIEQWNVMGYDEVYPLSYYEQKCREGLAFALEDKDGAILCAAVLLENDSRWSDDAPALYVHNLVSKVGAGNAGANFLRRAGEYALSINKEYLRLDSSEDNEPLAKYYENLGFVPVGTCTDGPYKGVRREKKLK